MPYSTPDIAVVIPLLAHIHSHVWCNNTPVLNFSIVEWYNEDQVMRKIGCKQDISDVIQNFDNVHETNKKGKNQKIGHKSINNIFTLWNAWIEGRPPMDFDFGLQPSVEYQRWYIENQKPYLFDIQLMVVWPHMRQRRHQHRQQGHLPLVP